MHFIAYHIMQLFCTPIYTRHTYEMNTHYKRDIFNFKRPNKTKKKKLHHYACINAKPWDLNPIGSPEGHGTTPFEGYQRWPKTGSLGAVMRLTALRHSLQDRNRHPTKPSHSKKKKNPPNYPPLLDTGLAHYYRQKCTREPPRSTSRLT